MKTLLQIIFALILSVGCSVFAMGNESFSTQEEKKDSVIIKCKPTVEKCVLIVANDLEILIEFDSNIITAAGLLPTQLISVTLEPDLQKNRPKLWNAIPAIYREKMVSVFIIKHRGKIDLDNI